MSKYLIKDICEFDQAASKIFYVQLAGTDKLTADLKLGK